ncbi:MAG: HAMP domain-containing protein [Candidatus Competibacteraceae bacterium]
MGGVCQADLTEAFEPVTALRNAMIVMAVVVAIAVALLALFVAGLIARPIIRMAGTITQIAANRDLTLAVPVESRDEVGRMSAAFNQMMQVIRNAFGVVSSTATTVDTSANEVAKRAAANRERAQTEAEQSETAAKIISRWAPPPARCRRRRSPRRKRRIAPIPRSSRW